MTDSALDALKHTKWLKSLLKGLTSLDEELTEIGNLEDLKRKVEQTIEAKKAERKKLEEELVQVGASAKAIVDAAKAKGEEMFADAKAKVGAAQAEAVAAVDAAKQEARRIVAVAKQEADAVKAAVSGSAMERDRLRAEVDDLRTVSKSLEEQVAALTAKKSELEGEIDAFRKKFA